MAPKIAIARQIPGARPAPMPRFIEPCLATLRTHAPPGPAWVHEIKYDGYRLQLHIAGDRVTLLTRRGYDWTARFQTRERRSRGDATEAVGRRAGWNFPFVHAFMDAIGKSTWRSIRSCSRAFNGPG